MDAHLSDPMGKDVGKRLAQDVVRPIHIRVQTAPSARLEEAALETLPSVDLLLGHWLQIQEAAPGGVALLCHHDPHANQGGLVGQQLDEAGMRNEDERLVVSLAQADLLLPADILPNHQGADAFLEQEADNSPAGGVQIGLDGARAVVGEMVQGTRGGLVVGELARRVGFATGHDACCSLG